MVLYKRKPVTFVRPQPIPADLSTQIFVIPQTKEWFLEYDEYISRMDYYHRRKFVCEITGNSCLTFFEAYESELKEIKDVQKNFPEALREHILRFLQFNRITRLDQLVDKVYLVFKNDYFPGEEVFVKKVISTNANGLIKSDITTPQSYVSTVKQRGTIREKVQYSNPSDTKYLVSTLGDGTQIIATNQQLLRDRNHFTKWLIKTYVKLTVTRSHKVGAPWVVKDEYAKKYRIPREYPDDLKHYESSTPSGKVLYEEDGDKSSPAPSQEPELRKKGRGKSLKKKAALNAAAASMGTFEVSISDLIHTKSTPKNETRMRFPVHHLPISIQRELEENELVTISSFQPSKKTIIDDLKLSFDLQTTRPGPSPLVLPLNGQELHQRIKERLTRDIEALSESESKEDALIIAAKQKQADSVSKSSLNSVQEALECWSFLNIYHSVLKLDTFTFDDFICAMSWNDEQFRDVGRCELLDEIWCAALGGIVSNLIPNAKEAADDGKVFGLLVSLPPKVAVVKSLKSEEDDDEMRDDKASDSEEESKILKSEDEASDNELNSETPAPKMLDGKLKEDVTDDNIADDEADSDEEEDELDHKAYSVMNHRGVKWHERLRKRNFKDGNWQTILLGVLSMVEYVPEFKDTIEETYHILAPNLICPATTSTVLNQFYSSMSVDLRLKALHILITLMVNGTLVREYLDESLDASTTLRRTRLDTIRDLKNAVETTTKCHVAIFEMLIEAANTSTDTDLWYPFTRKKHRLNIKGYEMAEYEKALAEANPRFRELWDEREAGIVKIRELREAKKKVEMKLSEMDCQRVRLLGKDRSFNRYWWFENNGLPNLHFAGGGDEDDEQPEPESEDDMDDKDENMEETYLMGRLWVQGPTALDSLLNLNLPKEEGKEIEKRLYSEQLADTVAKEGEDGPAVQQEPELFDLEDGGQPLKVMNFDMMPKRFLDEANSLKLKFHTDSIVADDSTEVVDRLGGLPKGTDISALSLLQRKFIEEAPTPLLTGENWGYFDTTDAVDGLVKWLNPWGKRESGLRKELLRVKEGLVTSITARRKALWLDKLPKDEVEIEDSIEAVDAKIEKLKADGVEATDDGEESDDDVTPRKRPSRTATTPNKRQKTTEETMKSGNLEELGKLQTQLQDDLRHKVAYNRITRVLEWVNGTAKDEFDRSLYDGGDRPKTKGRRPKK